MSGGLFDYQDEQAKSAIFGWTDRPGNVFEDIEISHLIWDVFDLIHDFDWYRSGDTCEETWLKRKREFKEKWFESVRKDRIKEFVDIELEEAKNRLYKSFDIEEEV